MGLCSCCQEVPFPRVPKAWERAGAAESLISAPGCVRQDFVYFPAVFSGGEIAWSSSLLKQLLLQKAQVAPGSDSLFFFFFWEVDQIMQHFVLWGIAGRGEDLIPWRLRKSMFTACTNLKFNNRT